MNNFLLRYGDIIKKALLIVAVFIIFYLIIFKIIPFLMPFVVALLFAVIIDPGVNFLEKKLKVPRGLASFILLLILIGVIGSLIAISITQLIYELSSLAEISTNYANTINDIILNLVDRIRMYYVTLPPNITSLIENNMQSILNYISLFAKNLATWLLNFATKLPNFFFMTLITLVATFFISKDKQLILDFIKRQIPSHWAQHAKNIQVDLLKTFFGYLRAVAAIMLITFLEVSIGLAMIGFDYPFLLGLLVTIVDALPVLGSGAVMVPWALYNIIMKNYMVGIYLLILYGLVVVVRQMIEPKIVGQSIGLHPLVTLLSMFIGAKLFGALGLVIGPVFVVVFKALQKAEIIPPWK
ncbi:MAG TPA: sporulation integral membrane protein YtvI [Thermoanaerobacter sp.]|nr:sporulation integral membrane protein YtvI [Thermoanaerobacter sp.]